MKVKKQPSILKLFKLVFFMGLIIFIPTHCSKVIDTTPIQPGPPPRPTVKYKPIKVKFLEYGSSTVLVGVAVKSYKCEESGKIACSRSRLLNSWVSDSNGMIEITDSQQQDTIFSFTLSKTDYYPILDPNKYGTNLVNLADTIISLPTYDSAVVRLFPYGYIRFHMKNSVQYKNKETIRTMIDAVRSISNTISLESFLPWNQPANNLDTVIIYKTFGNIDNRINIELDDSASNFIKMAYSGIRFVPKKDTLNWIINY